MSSCCNPTSEAADPNPVLPAYPTSSVWTSKDYAKAVGVRLFNRLRNNYKVKPGLYRLGTPLPASPVFVSANYKLSFDLLRKSLSGIDAWILVLDTSGINVWCAAGKGTFGTAELCKRILLTRLHEQVSHRNLIVPQLGAPGIKAHEVIKLTQFQVEYGPVRARDIPAYLQNNRQATPDMRTIRFPLIDRLVLTPMELMQGGEYLVKFLFVVLLLLGLSTDGVSFADAWEGGRFIVWGGLIAFLSGALLTPLLLPFIPFRAFALKGLLTGLAGLALFAYVIPDWRSNPALALFFLFGIPAFSSFLALNFTGATTFTNPSGVKREMKAAIPFYLVSGVVMVVTLVIYIILQWRAL